MHNKVLPIKVTKALLVKCSKIRPPVVIYNGVVVWSPRRIHAAIPVGCPRLTLGDTLHNLLLTLDGEQPCNLWWWLCTAAVKRSR